MKKARIIAVIAALIVSLSGCANTDRPQTIQDSSGIETVTSEAYERTESEERSSASISESKENAADSTAIVKAETESAQAENSQPVLSQESSTSSQQPEETKQPENTPALKQEEHPAVSEKPPVPEPPKAAEPTPEPKPEPTPPPAQQPPKVEQPETPAITPTPSESEPPAFDVSTYVQAAKDYGTEIGLAQDSAATACWDDPLTANARCLYLERDLRDRLDWYKESGFAAFWVWAEQTGDGEYLLYIGYA